MNKKVRIDEDKWFELEQFDTDLQYIVLTGARGCGKTVSIQKEVKKHFNLNEVCLYIRNKHNDVSTARQYFDFLCKENEVITLGSLGASSIVLENRERGDKVLVGYSLFISDYEVFKSSKRKIDYVIYEEFSSFSSSYSVNRIFSLTEIIETISQTRKDFKFYALSNNIFEDDLFDNLLNEEDFIHYQIVKKTNKDNIKNLAIRHYLEGEYLVPDIVINLSEYRCLGYVQIANSKLYIFQDEFSDPEFVVSSSGNGKELKIDTSLTNMLRRASYRSLKERNKCEFLTGLLKFSSSKIRV